MYVVNGMIMESWTPAAEGAGYELTPTLAALAPYRDRFSVLSGLACVPVARAVRAARTPRRARAS